MLLIFKGDTAISIPADFGVDREGNDGRHFGYFTFVLA